MRWEVKRTLIDIALLLAIAGLVHYHFFYIDYVSGESLILRLFEGFTVFVLFMNWILMFYDFATKRRVKRNKGLWLFCFFMFHLVTALINYVLYYRKKVSLNLGKGLGIYKSGIDVVQNGQNSSVKANQTWVDFVIFIAASINLYIAFLPLEIFFGDNAIRNIAFPVTFFILFVNWVLMFYDFATKGRTKKGNIAWFICFFLLNMATAVVYYFFIFRKIKAN